MIPIENSFWWNLSEILERYGNGMTGALTLVIS